MGTLTFVPTLIVCIATDVSFIFTMMLALNGFMGGSEAFDFYIVAIIFKSVIVSIVSVLPVVFFSQKPFFNSIIASIFLVLLAVIIFSIINLAIDFLGALMLMGIMQSKTPNRKRL